jgi:hypothetical protein
MNSKQQNTDILTDIIYQGTDILPEIFSSSPDRRVFVARKLHEGFSPRVILSDKHECWTARKNFWRYISVPRYIRKRIARKNFSLGQLYRKFLNHVTFEGDSHRAILIIINRKMLILGGKCKQFHLFF